MTDRVEEEVWKREEDGARHIVDGDIEKSISFYHDQFLGWPETRSPLVDRRGIREIIQRDMDETGPYSFRIERLGIRVFDNIATTHLIFHCAGKTHEGADFDESYRWTHTWIHDDSEWTLLAGVSYQVENA